MKAHITLQSPTRSKENSSVYSGVNKYDLGLGLLQNVMNLNVLFDPSNSNQHMYHYRK
jgi:hypothetical protein